MKNLWNEEWRMKNEEYELVLFAWETPLRPQAEERNLSSPKGGQEGGFKPENVIRILHSSFYILHLTIALTQFLMVMYRPYYTVFLTVVNTFSALFSEKYFFWFVIPPFHLCIVTTLIISSLHEVELGVEYRWNYMKFHPYSTHNSTTSNTLTLKHITHRGWKGGTSFA